MEKASSSWFSSPTDYRSLYLSYIYYLRRRVSNSVDIETKLKQIQDVRSMLEQGQNYLFKSIYYNTNCSIN